MTTGRFAFAALQPGRFTITASKSPYVTMSYGQTTPGKGLGLPILVEPGHEPAGLTIKLPPGSSVGGRVVDERGQGVRGSWVIAQQYRVLNGARIARNPQTGRDGLGGNLSVFRPSSRRTTTCVRCRQATSPANDPSFVVGPELRQTTPDEIQWAMQQLRPGRGRVRRGDAGVAGGQRVSRGASAERAGRVRAHVLPGAWPIPQQPAR